MTLSELLDMMWISPVPEKMRVIILESNWAMSGEKIYDKPGIDDNCITRRIMKGVVDGVHISLKEVIIDIHTEDI